MNPSLPRLCFVGPLVGRHQGYVTTQGEILSDHFAAAGYPVIETSSHPNRYARLADIAATIIRHRREIDVLVINAYGGPSFVVEDLASRLGRQFGHRVVVVLRGGAMPEFMARFPRWSRRVLGRAHAIIAPSDYLARAMAGRGFHARVIPNIIDISKYPFRLRRELRPHLFWMRTFHDAWNPLMAVRVLAKLRNHAPDARLVIAGQDKGLESESRALAEELGVSDAVRFPGFLNMAAKIAAGDAADIFISTNRIDNMPVAVVEACAFGLPVVSTGVGGMGDLLTDGETGLLTPDNDDERMVEAIRRLLDDPALAARLSANGRRLAERSSWEQVRVQWEAVFEEVLSAASNVPSLRAVARERLPGPLPNGRGTDSRGI